MILTLLDGTIDDESKAALSTHSKVLALEKKLLFAQYISLATCIYDTDF
jgi:hypothetical protein